MMNMQQHVLAVAKAMNEHIPPDVGLYMALVDPEDKITVISTLDGGINKVKLVRRLLKRELDAAIGQDN